MFVSGNVIPWPSCASSQYTKNLCNGKAGTCHLFATLNQFNVSVLDAYRRLFDLKHVTHTLQENRSARDVARQRVE